MRLFKSKTLVKDPDPDPKGFAKLKIFSSKTSPPLAAADQPPERAKGQKVTPEELRRLRELMRQRYALDLEIWWNLRKVLNHDKPFVMEKMKQADALLACIRAMVLSWDNRDYFYTDDEYEKLKEVKCRVMSAGKRDWVLNPPWNED